MTSDSLSLKVLSYNIHKGFGIGNLQFLLEEIRAAIRLVDADLVFLQEVCGEAEQTDSSQFEYLADSIWDHHAYGKNAIYQSGNHGNAVLSKFPFMGWENIDISTHKYSRRGLLHGVVNLEVAGQKKNLHVLCTHMGLFEGERKVQVEKMCARIRENISDDEPIVLAGDFNDWRSNTDKIVIEELGLKEGFKSQHGSLARTFPSWAPFVRLDRVYYRGFEVTHAEILSGSPWNRLSDHLPIFLKFRCS